MAEKFFADATLGKLARWLRVLGVDCAYDRELGFEGVRDKARAEDRVLLTRNTRFRGTPGQPWGLFVTSNHLPVQLEEFRRVFSLPPAEERFTRCLVCNERLVAAAEAEVERQAPVHVRSTRRRFTMCPSCRRVYWRGTHHGRMSNRLARLLAESPPSKQDGPAGAS
jgi:hypothetical protein